MNPPELSQINYEHDHIIQMIDAIKHRYELGHIDPAALVSMVSGMLSYAEHHFSEEEKLMESLNYFDYEGHKETHATFIKMSAELYNTLLEDPSYLPDVLRIFANWFATHIDIEMFLFARAVSRAKKSETFPTITGAPK